MVLDLQPSDLSLEQRWESCRLAPYLDAVSIPTQGFGATRGLSGEKVRLTDAPWTPAQALMVLRRDALIASRGMDPLISVALTQRQWDALVSWVFNLGAPKLKCSTLRRAINDQNPSKTAQQWLAWNRAGGKVLLGLTKRRTAELAYWQGIQA